MDKNKEDIIQNTEAENVVDAADDGIQYTFVVPKGEIYREPEDESANEPQDEPADDAELAGEPEDEPAAEAGPVPGGTIVADRRRFTEEVNDALQDAAEADAGDLIDPEDAFFESYKAAFPTGRTIMVEPPIYDATGLPEDDDIVYTFVVPKGEIYKEPDPEEEAAEKAEAAEKEAAAEEGEKEGHSGYTEILSAETKVMERPDRSGDESKTRYGLPVNHPAMGELAQKQEARRLYKQRKRNRFRTRFYVLMTALILLIFWLIISNSGFFTIDAIEVRGNSHYTAEEIINIGHATSGRNIIYKANIKETKEFLEQNPYIKSAEVRRKLPSTLVIKVTEREERLAFKYDDDYLVMDEDGILLKKTRNKPKTTIIQGVVVSKIRLGEKIGAEDSDKMDKALALIKAMTASDLYYVKADISKEKNVSAYIYDTLVVKADYDTLMTNMENGRLHLVVEKLFADGIERGTITFLDDGSASFMPTF